MAKISGLGWTTLSLDSSVPTLTDIKNDVTSLEISTPREVQEVTGVDLSAMERIYLLADAQVTLNGVFNVSVSHPVLKTIPTATLQRTLSLAVASQTLSMEMLATDYSVGRSDSGELTWEVPLVLANGTAPAWS